MAMQYSIILPAYNEAVSIERAIRETAAVFGALHGPFEILVVDDGSSDGTAALVASLRQDFPQVRLLRHETNRGKGAAVATGVASAQGETVLFLDCDLATHPSEALRFIERLKEADIVIGSRRAVGTVIAVRQSWYRVACGRMINFFLRHWLKLPHRDTQCGFKMFRIEAARDLFSQLSPTRWTFDAEILLRAQANGYRVAELPVTWTNGRLSRVKTGEVLADLWYLLQLKNNLDK